MIQPGVGFPASPLRRAYPGKVWWELVREVDFSRISDRDWQNSDGGKSAAGIAMTVGNSANADTFAITEGSGLQIAPKDNTVYTAASITAPYLEIDLSELVPDADRPDRLFIVVRVSDAGLDSGTNRDGRALRMGVGSGTSSGTYFGFIGATYAAGLEVEASAVRNTDELYASVTATVQPQYLGLGWSDFVATPRSATATDWPLPSAMDEGLYAFNVATGTPTLTDTRWSPSTDALRLYASRDDGATTPDAFTATFEAIRISRQCWGRP